MYQDKKKLVTLVSKNPKIEHDDHSVNHALFFRLYMFLFQFPFWFEPTIPCDVELVLSWD